MCVKPWQARTSLLLDGADEHALGEVLLQEGVHMCVYPFLQKHFAKGVLIGAVKE